MFPKRGSIDDSTHVTESVMSQFLTELDGVEELKEVFVIGATNRPDLLDSALLRPGRLEKHLYIPPPDEAARKEILTVYFKGLEDFLDPEIQIDDLAKKTRFFVGADLEALVREVKALIVDELTTNEVSVDEDKILENSIKITQQHFDTVLDEIKGSLDGADFERYEQKSWDLLYGKSKRDILYQAVNLINQIEYLKGKYTISDEIIRRAEELRDLVYWQRKSFDTTQKCTDELRQVLEDFVKKNPAP
jgi:transitional endoplasmic reticulum ATPase